MKYYFENRQLFVLESNLCCHMIMTSKRYIEDFDVLHGDVQGLSDTMSFLKSLAELNSVYDSGNAEKRQMRERKAAAGLFNWEVAIFLLIFYLFISW